MGYFSPDAELGSVQELLAERAQRVTFADPNETLREVIARMAATGISQMPVASGQGDIRMIEELDILRAVASNEHGLQDSVRDVARPLQGRVGLTDSLSQVQKILKKIMSLW